MINKYSILFSFLVSANVLFAQNNSQLYIPRNIQKAYDSGTRNINGTPGQHFWKNYAEYYIQVSFNPKTRKIEGEQNIIYYNNSPDTLHKLVFRTAPDHYKKGSERNKSVDPEDIDDGLKIISLSVNAEPVNIADNKILKRESTIADLKIQPLSPRGGRLSVQMKWSYTLNKTSHERTGMIDDGTAFIAYFFPRITVYDDLQGWDAFPYLGRQETYFDNVSFNVFITVPDNFMVWATGDLQNPAEVLQPEILKKWTQALASDVPVFVIDSADIAKRAVTLKNKKNVFNFKTTAPDFVFAVSNHYLWQMRNMVVDSVTLRKTAITTAFNPIHKDFYEVNDFSAKTIHTMSFDFPGIPYPYSHLTVVDGLDQMEYPMMVNDNPTPTRFDGITLTTHEIFHQYFPFLMCTNQSKYAFMDEGWATIGEWYISPLIDTTIVDDYGMPKTNRDMGKDWDVPIIAPTTELAESMFINCYPKPALTFLYVWDMLGDSLFRKSLQHYIITWMDKSPSPWDFFFCMNEASGVNLNWFWKAWYFDFGFADLSITGADRTPEGYKVTIVSKGNKPVPVNLYATLADGTVLKQHRTVEVWKSNREIEVEFRTTQKVKEFKLGDVYDADVNKADNILKPEE
ncbi:MAG: M1 family metallopeptidase [Bacteroidetes bacterium]|jgi:hypothetical protein|nr:M1 family metallopeptidase [Bacteroidota bacterium]